MSIKVTMDNSNLKKLLLASGGALAATALPSSAFADCPEFPAIGQYATNIMCSKIPAGTHVAVSPAPANGSMVFFNARDGVTEMYYLSKSGADDSFGFTATDGAGVPLNAGFLNITAQDLASTSPEPAPAPDGK